MVCFFSPFLDVHGSRVSVDPFGSEMVSSSFSVGAQLFLFDWAWALVSFPYLAGRAPRTVVLRFNSSQKGPSWVKWLGIVVVGASLSVFSTAFASLHLSLQVCLSPHGTAEPPISQHVFAHVCSSLWFFS